VKEGLDNDVAIQLIKIAARHTLEAHNSLGRTALHYAVEGKRCSTGQIKVIEALLERGGGALDQYDISGKSVFEYHLSTRRGSHKKKSSSLAKASRRTRGLDDSGRADKLFSRIMIETDAESKKRDDESVQRLEDLKERGLLSPVKEKDSN
jgi:ankyrin repeat protein